MPRFLNEFGVSIAVLVFTFRPEVDPAISDTNPHPEQRTWIGKKDSRAISLSWCGKERSIPPEWISILSPSLSTAIAEHSICYGNLQ